MSMEGSAMTEYASLSGKIHSLVIDKSLSISGAAADSKATGEAIDKLKMMTPEEMDKTIKAALDTVETTYTVSVGTEWTVDDTNGGFYQTVAVIGILESDNPVVDVVLGSDVAANALYKEAWAKVDRVVTGNDSITLYANEVAPNVAFTIQLKVVR